MADPTEPKSNAPDFNKLEQDILKFWREDETFKKSLEKTKDGQPFIFYDGPPFATGLPHYGSILPSVIKDAIPRYQTMKGRYVRRRWGWDCHGLPIENIVEQHLKISGKKQIEEVGVERFNQVCRDNVLTYAREWGKVVERIARWVEFDNAYMTMQTSYMESVWWGLKQIWDKDLIYQDRKVLLYCSRCETPISNFEVAMDNSYRDITEESVYVKFKLLPKQRIGDYMTDDKTYALAWTTTPWTLPGNTALNVGPDIRYVLIEQNGQQYILAKERLEILDGEYEVKSEFSARSLEGLSYEPLYAGIINDPENKAHKIYPADFVTTTDGTGIVHNAAMYGEEDYQLAKQVGLPREDMLDHQGRYLPMAPEHLRGVFFKDADKIVLADLKDSNIYKTQHFTHSYPHCWRCGTPLFYNALPAWFINIQKIKAQLIEANQPVNWYPDHLKHGRFELGVQSAPDWTISRNRYWATPLPFWLCENKECKNVTCIGSVEQLREKATNFSEVYPDYDASKLEEIDLHKPFIDRVKLKCEKCESEMTRVEEVVDCWVESGSMPFAELHSPFENEDLFKKRFPSDFVVEYIPQTRAWFYVMHVINTVLFGKSPLKNVLTTGTILAEDGSKMSKSKGNYPDPNVVIEKHGADALRFYLMTSPVANGEDINFSEKSVSETSRKLNMLVYNVWSFYRMYAKGTINSNAPEVKNLLDRWVISRLNGAHTGITESLDGYNLPQAGRLIIEFIDDLSTWYVRRSRDRIKAEGPDAQQALATLGYVLTRLAKLLAPFTPFLAEFIYRDITGSESVHLQDWGEVQQSDEAVEATMSRLRAIVEAGLRMRKDNNLKVRQPLAELQYQITKELDNDAGAEQILAAELNVKKVSGSNEILSRSGWVIAENILALDTTLTPELKNEGLARELERAVQDLRKKSGLKVGELIDVYYNTQDENLAKALIDLVDRKKTFISQIKMSLEVEVDNEAQATIEGSAIWLGIVKA